jgi:hypothetical protein
MGGLRLQRVDSCLGTTKLAGAVDRISLVAEGTPGWSRANALRSWRASPPKRQAVLAG